MMFFKFYQLLLFFPIKKFSCFFHAVIGERYKSSKHSFFVGYFPISNNALLKKVSCGQGCTLHIRILLRGIVLELCGIVLIFLKVRLCLNLDNKYRVPRNMTVGKQFRLSFSIICKKIMKQQIFLTNNNDLLNVMFRGTPSSS